VQVADDAGAAAALDGAGDVLVALVGGSDEDGGSGEVVVLVGVVDAGGVTGGVHTTVKSAVAVPSASLVGPPVHVKPAVKCPARLPARP